jgi:hypothetical protein
MVKAMKVDKEKYTNYHEAGKAFICRGGGTA